MRFKEWEQYEAARGLEKKVGRVLFTVLFICLLLALIPMKVSGSSIEAAEETSYYDLERCFLEVLDMRLREYGYTDSGLTLNSIIYADGSRCYYVKIHHARITDAGAGAWEDLKLQIADIPFPIENCSVTYEIVP
ncbi:MAG: hypothetical protein K2J95_11145 [Lachnospiraceae bacterium]|nr:hypothetical protein [Lachnospiraceae bacterium]